ncbi:conserved hypothetical protein [Agrobacterium fabacearum S56]|uniref:glutamate cyclase domain-containing protein n=1 Tax=Agrobacterium tumefaciens TaxID=358 RepID=UPI0009B97575|nr:glutamate cyclase domain-containing protein [Agrobacterium tumefaciens]CUX07047.1 conserved hypothetical protein [Agrobacterium fabacearum S56]
MTTSKFAAIDERLDRLVNLDMGGRGVERLYAASLRLLGVSPVGAAADKLAALNHEDIVLVTTGSVSRAWISPEIGENDGPAGLAAVVRAISLSRRALCVVLAEETLLEPIGKLLMAAGVTVVPVEQGKIAARDKSLAVVSLLPFSTTDLTAANEASRILDELKPVMLFSTERVGRNADGIYCSMRGVDYGMDRARIDYVFDEAIRRGLPTVAVGDGGNEIGMGAIADAVRAHVRFGDARPEGGAGIGAMTASDILVTAAVSNWGCYAIVAALAARLKDPRLVHTPQMEEILLRRGVEIGLINSVDGLIDANVDGIPLSTHLAISEIIEGIVRPALR